MTRVFATLALLFAGLSWGKAENFVWAAETNLKFFADAANWQTEGGSAGAAPGASDDILSPLQYGTVSISGPQEVRNFQVQLDKKWLLIGKGAMVFGGNFVKGGQELIVRDGGNPNIHFDVTVEGSLTLKSGILRFGQETENGELNGITVEGPCTVRDGTLLFRSFQAELAGGLTLEQGVVAIYQASGSGGITVRGIEGISPGFSPAVRATAYAGF